MDLTDKKQVLKAMAKLRSSADGGAVIWWYRGSQYGIQEMQPTLLFHVEGVQLIRFDALADGSYNQILRDVMFYVNPESTELLRTWTNPYTGEEIDVPVMRMGPFTTNYSESGPRVILPDEMKNSGMDVSWQFESTVAQGGEVYIRETGHTEIPGPGAKKFVVNDFFTLVGSLTDVMNESIPAPKARISYQSINNWTPWINMGDRDGFVMGSGTGRKIPSTVALPPHLARLIDEHEPSFFADPDFTIIDRSFHPLNQDER
jgi:hypothetical protein